MFISLLTFMHETSYGTADSENRMSQNFEKYVPEVCDETGVQERFRYNELMSVRP